MQGVTHAELGAVGAGRRLQSVRLVLRDTDHRLVTVKVKLGALSGPFVSSLVCSQFSLLSLFSGKIPLLFLLQQNCE